MHFIIAQGKYVTKARGHVSIFIIIYKSFTLYNSTRLLFSTFQEKIRTGNKIKLSTIYVPKFEDKKPNISWVFLEVE